jgi:hypothetical protein
MRLPHLPVLKLARLASAFASVALAIGLSGGATSASAQVVTGGDFDISDNTGTLRGNTARIQGRAGFGTNEGIFVLVNASSVEQDVDNDGFTAGIDFTALFIADTNSFLNIENPQFAITKDNFVLVDFLNPLRNGFANQVRFLVNVPNGTPAGIYRGIVTIRDSVRLVGANPNGETLRADQFIVEIEVLANRDLTFVEADSAAELDSLVLRGKPGQTVSGVVRVANTGNVDLSNVRIEATDLVSTSGTGLRIRRDRIEISPTQVQSLGLGDTNRVVITVRIPVGILAGSYQGDLILQGEGVPERRVPLTVIVTTPGDIVFENNPVFGRAGDNAVIIFNADPGTNWSLRVFDMQAITAFAANGTVFAGGTSTDPTDPATPGDQAVRYTWNLQNGRGENVASGMYYVVIEATQAGQRRQLRGKLMVIR